MYILCKLNNDTQVWLDRSKVPTDEDEELKGVITGRIPADILSLPPDLRPWNQIHQQALRNPDEKPTISFRWRDVKSYQWCRDAEDDMMKIPQEKRDRKEHIVAHIEPATPVADVKQQPSKSMFKGWV